MIISTISIRKRHAHTPRRGTVPYQSTLRVGQQGFFRVLGTHIECLLRCKNRKKPPKSVAIIAQKPALASLSCLCGERGAPCGERGTGLSKMDWRSDGLTDTEKGLADISI